MTPQQIVGLGIRLLAIWLAIASFQYFVAIPAALENAQFSEKSIQAYVVAVIYACAALLLWLFPMWLAHKLLPRTRFENTINLQAAEAARVGCALIGLWFSIQGLLNAVWFLFHAFLMASSQSLFQSLGKDAQLDFIVTVANLAVGLVLIFQAGTFASFVIRPTAAPPNEEKPPAL